MRSERMSVEAEFFMMMAGLLVVATILAAALTYEEYIEFAPAAIGETLEDDDG